MSIALARSQGNQPRLILPSPQRDGVLSNPLAQRLRRAQQRRLEHQQLEAVLQVLVPKRLSKHRHARIAIGHPTIPSSGKSKWYAFGLESVSDLIGGFPMQ